MRICKVSTVPEILINVVPDHTASHPRRRQSSDPAKRLGPMGQRTPKRTEYNSFYEFCRAGFSSSNKRQYSGSMLLKYLPVFSANNCTGLSNIDLREGRPVIFTTMRNLPYRLKIRMLSTFRVACRRTFPIIV
jgi:hypothetical protein